MQIDFMYLIGEKVFVIEKKDKNRIYIELTEIKEIEYHADCATWNIRYGCSNGCYYDEEEIYKYDRYIEFYSKIKNEV